MKNNKKAMMNIKTGNKKSSKQLRKTVKTLLREGSKNNTDREVMLELVRALPACFSVNVTGCTFTNREL